MAESISITDYKDLRKLWTNKIQYRDPAKSEPRKVYAVDVETYQGDVFLIADSDKRYLDKITPMSLTRFLYCKKYQGAWNFFYRLEYDAEVILKAVFGNALSTYKTTGKLSFKYGDYRYTYYPKKCLTINKGHHSVKFYDIAQFYGKGLAKDYQDNIGPVDESYLGFKGDRSQFSPRFYRRNTNEVRNYCIQDCKYTEELSQHWIHLFYDIFGFFPQKWLSPAYLAEKVVINSGLNFPLFDSIPYDVQGLGFSIIFWGKI